MMILQNGRAPAVGTARGSVTQALGQGPFRKSSGVRIERKRPAFAGEVEALLRAGRQPNTYCYAGARCWERARLRRDNHGPGSTLVLVDDVPPDRWRWPAGLDAMVLAVDGIEPAQALAIARAAVAGGVRAIVVCGLETPALIRRGAA